MMRPAPATHCPSMGWITRAVSRESELRLLLRPPMISAIYAPKYSGEALKNLLDMHVFHSRQARCQIVYSQPQVLLRSLRPVRCSSGEAAQLQAQRNRNTRSHFRLGQEFVPRGQSGLQSYKFEVSEKHCVLRTIPETRPGSRDW